MANILVVTQYFWPESFRINDLVVGLRARGHRVEILTGMPNYPHGQRFPGYRWFGPSRETYEGMVVRRVPLITRGARPGWRLALNYFSFALMASTLGPLRCPGKFDLIFVYEPSPVTVGIPGILLGYLKDVPVVLWVQDLWPDTLEALGTIRPGLALHLASSVSDFVYRRCQRLLVQSKAFVSRLEARGVDPRAILYLPNWAEDFYRPLDSSTIKDKLPGVRGFRVVFAGNLGTAQSLETLIDAATYLRDIRDLNWVIIGDGHMRAWLEAEIAARSLNAKFTLTGRLPSNEMPEYFAHADILLATLRPDPVFGLTIPSKLQSYLACGRPVIAAVNGEAAHVIRDAQAGVACEAGNGLALAKAVECIYRMEPAARAEMGRCGRRYYETNFDRKQLLDRLDGWVHQLCGGARCADTHPRR